MKVLVAGASGQLGQDVVTRLGTGDFEVIEPSLEELDFIRPASIDEAIETYRPDVVINCAAYTQVDQAESEPETALTINRDAPARLAHAVAGCGGRLLHVSTDFVFDGRADTPYTETDAADPVSVYGISKLAGERAVLDALPGAIVLRTAWLYGARGHNFVKTILRVALEGRPLRVVDDQVGAPTWTVDLADAIACLVATDANGLFHYTNAGSTSWHGFAVAILEEAAAAGFDVKTHVVEPIPTADYPTPAARPAYSVLDTGKLVSLLGLDVPAWRDSLKLMLRELHSCEDCL